jgi:hypothetical protein
MEDRGSLFCKDTLEDLWSVHANLAEARTSKKETDLLISERNKDRGSCSVVSKDCDFGRSGHSVRREMLKPKAQSA